MADSYTKVVLALILVCLAWLLLGGTERERGAAADGSETALGRYEFVLFPLRRGRSLLVRHDTATGEAWGMLRWGGDNGEWIDISEVRPPAGAEAAPAAGGAGGGEESEG
jgi:hypothetical protein